MPRVLPQDLHHRGRDPVGLARREGLVGGLQEHALGEDVEQQRVLGAGQVRRLTERADTCPRRGRPRGSALVRHPAAGVLLGEEPGRGPVAPLEDLGAGQEVPLVVALEARGQDQGAKLRRKTVSVPDSPRPTARPATMPSPSPMSRSS